MLITPLNSAITSVVKLQDVGGGEGAGGGITDTPPPRRPILFIQDWQRPELQNQLAEPQTGAALNVVDSYPICSSDVTCYSNGIILGCGTCGQIYDT